MFRAYYLGHLGKYIPGKAWALLLRGQMVRGSGVRFGVAIVSAVFEVLTTMASGALLAAVLFALQPLVKTDHQVRSIRFEGWPEVHPVLLGAVLMALVGVPLLPGVFNRLVARLARRFQAVEAFQVPHLQLKTLALGLLLTGLGWCLLGVGVWALVQAVVPQLPPLTLDLEMQYTAAISRICGRLPARRCRAALASANWCWRLFSRRRWRPRKGLPRAWRRWWRCCCV